jgi:hypothetical protein
MNSHKKGIQSHEVAERKSFVVIVKKIQKGCFFSVQLFFSFLFLSFFINKGAIPVFQGSKVGVFWDEFGHMQGT